MRLTTRATAALVLGLSLVLTGCQNIAQYSSDAPQGATTQDSRTGAAEDPVDDGELPGPAESALPQHSDGVPAVGADDETCSGLTGEEAVAIWGPLVDPVALEPQWEWNLEGADTSTYDECAELSWVVLGIHGPTASSPYQIMLFHHGTYLGVTTEYPLPFEPHVLRLDDGMIQVTYTWAREGESNAEASGRSLSLFAWDDATGQVIHSGELPPTI